MKRTIFLFLCYLSAIISPSCSRQISPENIRANISLNEPQDVKYSSVRISGSLTIETRGTFSKSVAIYYSPTETTITGLQSSGIEQPVSLSVVGSFLIELINLDEGVPYHYAVVATIEGKRIESEVKTFTTISLPIPEAVDMGLNVKWASFNVGAEKPEDYGNYYAWGETHVCSNYGWHSYPFCNLSSFEPYFTKYCTDNGNGIIDNKTELERDDDVAFQKYKGNWRMPTDAEWNDLRDLERFTWIWTTNNGINGYLVTSKKTSKSIFLPAAGQREADYLTSEGELGLYWSSSLSTNDPKRAWDIVFSEDGVKSYFGSFRHFGRSVRPVCD